MMCFPLRYYIFYFFFFFFNDTATTEIYTLSLHDALPISSRPRRATSGLPQSTDIARLARLVRFGDRKSTRLNSSHLVISYAVFCLKKKELADSAALFYNKLVSYMRSL